MPFFGSGIVELPPGGFKHRKSTRRMQMVFFVHYGKVTVEVGGTRFVITKGGMWQVPRGELNRSCFSRDSRIPRSPCSLVVASKGEVFVPIGRVPCGTCRIIPWSLRLFPRLTAFLFPRAKAMLVTQLSESNFTVWESLGAA